MPDSLPDGTQQQEPTSPQGSEGPAAEQLQFLVGDFAERRRLAILWAWALNPSGLERALERVRPGDVCTKRQMASEAPSEAVLGDDGRFHVRGSRMLCSIPERGMPEWVAPREGWERPRPEPSASWRHEAQLRWWVDEAGRALRTASQAITDPNVRELTAVWHVTAPDGAGVDPGSVPLSQRCPIAPAYLWPPARSTSPIGILRSRLASRFGPRCSLCGVLPGSVVDHDHFDGLVRGLLCGVCNTGLESCLHVDRCPRALYLNDPPAAALRLTYPSARKTVKELRHAERRIAALGFDPFELLRS
ncbi:endonuclease domain-containing protein [Kitasatospora sp. NPDC048296]|uniref:endonuclease domain-containing protein n=1 Tax=Kitasatospora sp. NPDC048296 TaxID=3364048 RepID=UPI00371D9946